MARWPKVLVTGAEEHQGLAVIRGLGRANIPVVACGVSRRSLGFYSRYVIETATYTSPFVDQERFLADMLQIVHRTQPALIIPTTESSLVVLNAGRALLPTFTALAAPPPDTLDAAIDKLRTLQLAEAIGVPVPRTAWGDNLDEILGRVAHLKFPVAIKPRGNSLHTGTANSLGFKVRYASTLDQLRQMLAQFGSDVRAVLVQEFATGAGRCVAAVCREGTPLMLFPYARDREYPLSGGVSVMRSSVPLDPRVAEWTARLLGAMGWQGVAMVEFKYDAEADHYTLMEVNGRFQASTALSLDAGINLPYLVACVFLNRVPRPMAPYRLGVRERWMRGDLMALRDGLSLERRTSSTRSPAGKVPSRFEVIWRFLRDFTPGTHYDEFKIDDWKPAVIESAALGKLAAAWLIDIMKEPLRRLRKSVERSQNNSKRQVSDQHGDGSLVAVVEGQKAGRLQLSND